MTEVTKKIIKLIAIYGRVSTARQEEEETIKTQLVAVREFAEKNGYTIVQEYLDDGWSGDMLARPALDRLREDARKKIWEAVLIYDPDRLARRYSFQELVMDELRDLGLEMIFVTTPAPKTGEERILHGVKGLFAEYERVKITERFRLGKIRKAKEGHIILTEAPYGYTYVTKRDGKQGYLEINQTEARVVEQLFHWVADEGLTLRKIVRKLHELGMKPRKSKKGVWSTSTLSNLLRNRTYIGEANYGASYAVVPEKPLKKEGYKKIRKTSRKLKPEEEWIKISVLALIDKELFYRAAQRMKANFDLSWRNRKNPYLLAGKIYCSCGYRRTGEGSQQGKHLYYRCSERVHTFPMPPKCKEKGVNAGIADDRVWKKIKELMSSPELLTRQVNHWVNQQHRKVENSEIAAVDLERELGKLSAGEDRYLKAYGAELITIEKLQEYTASLRERKSAIKAQMDQVKEEERRLDEGILPQADEVKQFAIEARKTLQSLNFGQRRAIVMDVVDKVVGNKEALLVTGVIPVTTSDYVSFRPLHRDCGVAECGEVHAFSVFNKAGG